MVGHRPLKAGILVRIQAPQLWKENYSWDLAFVALSLSKGLIRLGYRGIMRFLGLVRNDQESVYSDKRVSPNPVKILNI